MGGMSVSSCRCCILVFYVHPVVVFCILHNLYVVNAG